MLVSEVLRIYFKHFSNLIFTISIHRVGNLRKFLCQVGGSCDVTTEKSRPDACSSLPNHPLAAKCSLSTPGASPLFFDGCSYNAPPFGPGAVVVTDVLKPQELRQNEPRMRGALPDAAVGDGLCAAINAIPTIEPP